MAAALCPFFHRSHSSAFCAAVNQIRDVTMAHRKRRLDDIGFPIDAGGFSGACGKHHLQQRLQYLLQSFAAVLAGGLRIEAGYVAAAARSTLKFHGSS
jgi:hypothetical protein